MKLRLYFFFVNAFCYVVCNQVAIAKTITIGKQSSASSAYSGLHAPYKFSSAEFVIQRSEINDTGDIKTFAFYKSGGDSTSGIDSVHIYLKESDSAVNAKVSMAGYTEIFSGILPNNLSTGWVKINLAIPFTYSGSKNLAVLVVRKNGTKITTRYPNYAVSFSNEKEFNAAYYSSDTNPWKSSPLESAQNRNLQYRPMIQLNID